MLYSSSGTHATGQIRGNLLGCNTQSRPPTQHECRKKLLSPISRFRDPRVFVLPNHCSPGAHLGTQHLFPFLLQLSSTKQSQRKSGGNCQDLAYSIMHPYGSDHGNFAMCITYLALQRLILIPDLDHGEETFQPPKNKHLSDSLNN